MTVAEGIEDEKRTCACCKLQWGRNLTVAEGWGRIRLLHWNVLTSMGPQLDSCGRAATASMSVGTGAYFNGAAT